MSVTTCATRYAQRSLVSLLSLNTSPLLISAPTTTRRIGPAHIGRDELLCNFPMHLKSTQCATTLPPERTAVSTLSTPQPVDQFPLDIVDDGEFVRRLIIDGAFTPTPIGGTNDSANGSAVPLSCHLTYRPNVLKRKRKHGFLRRKLKKDGRNILNNRRLKGRHRLSA